MTIRQRSRRPFGVGLLASGLGVAALVAAQQPGTPAETGAFIAALESCRPATVNTPHPLMATFIVEHAITGEKEGACGYTQTMPGRMKMVCALSQDGRKILAADLKTMVSGGSMRGGTNAAQPQWFKECEIELPSGSRVPAAQGRGR